MKKLTGSVLKRVQALFISAALLLGALGLNGMNRAGAASQSARVAGFSLTIGEGALGLNIYFSGIADSQAKNMTAKVDGFSYALSAKQPDGTYMVTHPVNAKDIVKKSSISLYSGNTKVNLANSSATNGIVTASVEDYLVRLEESGGVTGTLAEAISDYGKSAYAYFTGTQNTLTLKDADFSAYRMSLTGDLPSYVSYYGSSLVLKDKIAIRHYYLFTYPPSASTLTVDGVTTTAIYPYEENYEAGYAIWYVEIPDIRAWDIDHTYELIATIDGKQASLKYSVLSYADEALAMNPNDSLGKLVKSIYWYNVAFRAYLAATSEDPYSEYPEEELPTEYITYEMFGAKGDGVTDDYDAIVLAHEAANERNLPVKARAGANYYIGHMGYFLTPVEDGKSRNLEKGALIMTNTDWTGAKFTIDDSKLQTDIKIIGTNAAGEPVYDDYVVYGDCYLFTVEPSQESRYAWMPTFLYWKQDANGKWVSVNGARAGYEQMYLGLDPNLSAYPDHSLPVGSNYSGALAAVQKNKTFDMNTVKFGEPGEFREDALYILKSSAFKRWGRYGSDTASSPARSQEEIIIVNQDGTLADATPLQWDWDKIEIIWKYPIDKTPLTVTGGQFYTIVNTCNIHDYIHRGINIARSNVTLFGVEHYLLGEDACFGRNGEHLGYDSKGNEVHLPRYGAPQHGFFRITNCAYITLKNCVFSNHLHVYSYGNDGSSTAPYDVYSEYCAGLTIDGCVCAPDEDDLTGPGDPTGIMDWSRWGTTGTNYCKTIRVLNSRLNRVDAHMGTYNLEVKDSYVGCRGILAVGFGEMNIERVTAYSEYFIYLRRDYGSYWNGNITIKDCVWRLSETTKAPWLVFANYKPNTSAPYGFDPIEEDGVTYYGTLPTTISVDGFLLDASRLTGDNLASFNDTSGFQMFSCPIWDLNFVVNDANLANRNVYKYPLRVTKLVSMRRLTINRNTAAEGTTFKGVSIINNGEKNQAYLFRNTTFDFTPSKHLTMTYSAPWVFEWLNNQ